MGKVCAVVTLLVGWLCVAGCLQPNSTTCGEYACAANYVCLADRCTSQNEIEACTVDGTPKADDSECRTPSGAGHCQSGACRVPVCGDSYIDGPEQCDGTVATLSSLPNAACRSNCQLARCGDGVVDDAPAGRAAEACDDGNDNNGDGCHNDCQFPQCGDGIVDSGEQCDNGANNNDGDGACHTDCKLARCGDHVQDSSLAVGGSGEQCDDGNAISGDGCSQDCRSNEACGNGIVDGLTGEECDRGIFGLSGDGCSSSCRVEAQGWREATPTTPLSRFEHMVAYDSDRRRMIIFGGYEPGTDGTVVVDTTLEWNGVAWDHRNIEQSPAARRRGAMAFDAQRHRTVLFGGFDAANAKLGDTWEYDGRHWYQRTLVVHPPAMVNGAMAYDSTRKVLCLFGDPSAVWELDAVGWTKHDIAATPWQTPRATDFPDVTRVVVVDRARTYRWDGTTLTDLALPAPSTPEMLGYDGRGHRVIGFAPALGDTADDLWMLDATLSAWTSKLSQRSTAASQGVFDPTTRSIWMFGGFGCVSAHPGLCGGHQFPLVISAATINDDPASIQQWSFSGDVTPPSHPSTTAATYDQQRGTVVAFGGADIVGIFDWTVGTSSELWEWNGTDWIRKDVNSLYPRHSAAMTWNDDLGEAFLFGGATYGGVSYANGTPDPLHFEAIDDTWSWNGTQWHNRAQGATPPARFGHALAYDRARHVVVLAGGEQIPDDGAFTDTWEWDTINGWQQRSSTGPFCPYAGMAYDDDAHVSVLLCEGGTFEWDGTTWTQRAPYTGDKPSTLTYDRIRKRVLNVRGSNVFEWTRDNGMYAWRPLLVTSRLPPRTRATLAYDARRNQVVAVGGYSAGTVRLDTWTLSYRNDFALADRCIADTDTDGDGLKGCADPDCWARCTPQNPPCVATATVSCPMVSGRYCGDGVCNQELEGWLLCPLDCVAP